MANEFGSPPSVRKSRIENRKFQSAFSLVELLIVIAVIAIMASLVISAFSNASADSRLVLVNQQQAVLQEALNAWISHESSGTDANGKKLTTDSARTTYTNAATGAAKLALVTPYLADSPTGGAQYSAHASIANAFQTSTMVKTQQYVTFSTWASGSYPKIVLNP